MVTPGFVTKSASHRYFVFTKKCIAESQDARAIMIRFDPEFNRLASSDFRPLFMEW
jgi:hypothetical protein